MLCTLRAAPAYHKEEDEDAEVRSSGPRIMARAVREKKERRGVKQGKTHYSSSEPLPLSGRHVRTRKVKSLLPHVPNRRLLGL